MAGDVALQASFDVADGFALGEVTLDVVLCGAVLTHADQHDGVQGAVELSISRPVQSVPGDGARRRLDGCGTAQFGEGSLRTDAAVMGPGGDDLTGHDRADSQLVEQLRGEPSDQQVELDLKLGGAAPIEASSGTITRHRLNRSGDRQLNRALHTIVLVRMRQDSATKEYVQRRLAQGKTIRDIKRCLKRYIARQLFRQLEALTPTT